MASLGTPCTYTGTWGSGSFAPWVRGDMCYAAAPGRSLCKTPIVFQTIGSATATPRRLCWCADDGPAEEKPTGHAGAPRSDGGRADAGPDSAPADAGSAPADAAASEQASLLLEVRDWLEAHFATRSAPAGRGGGDVARGAAHA
eukprot:5043340-Prymnesium_polylepis.1